MFRFLKYSSGVLFHLVELFKSTNHFDHRTSLRLQSWIDFCFIVIHLFVGFRFGKQFKKIFFREILISDYFQRIRSSVNGRHVSFGNEREYVTDVDVCYNLIKIEKSELRLLIKNFSQLTRCTRDNRRRDDDMRVQWLGPHFITLQWCFSTTFWPEFIVMSKKSDLSRVEKIKFNNWKHHVN